MNYGRRTARIGISRPHAVQQAADQEADGGAQPIATICSAYFPGCSGRAGLPARGPDACAAILTRSLRGEAGGGAARSAPRLARAQRPGCGRTRQGCVVQLLVDVNENGVVFDLACVNRDGAAGEHTDGLARGQVVA